MKKDKQQLLRIQSLIENDRLSADESFSELVAGDLGRVLNDYFDFKELPIVKIEKFGDRFKVEFSILASRIKSFESLPD